MTVSEGPHLQISPTELKFRLELKKNIPVTLSLHNPGTERVGFKVKTTSPKKYCVRPSSGFVDPGTTKDVQVIMQAQREYPGNLAECKDKFLVQWVKVDNDVKDVLPDAFDAGKNKEIKQSKLRVTLVGPPKPPSPVPEGNEEEPSPNRDAGRGEPQVLPGHNTSAGADDLATVLRERNRLREQVTRLERDNKEMLRRVEQGGQAGGVASRQKVIRGGFNIIHIILVAIIALLVGRWL
eukprot:jgi/Astpho2/6534/Aster-07318